MARYLDFSRADDDGPCDCGNHAAADCDTGPSWYAEARNADPGPGVEPATDVCAGCGETATFDNETGLYRCDDHAGCDTYTDPNGVEVSAPHEWRPEMEELAWERRQEAR